MISCLMLFVNKDSGGSVLDSYGLSTTSNASRHVGERRNQRWMLFEVFLLRLN